MQQISLLLSLLISFLLLGKMESIQIKQRIELKTEAAPFSSLFTKEKELKELSTFDNLFEGGFNLDTIPTTDFPTSRPTQSPKTREILSFKIVIRLDHVDTDTFQQNSFDATKETITVVAPITLPRIGDGSIVDKTRRSLLEESTSSVHVSDYVPYNNTFIVSYPVLLPLKDYPKYSGNATALFNYIKGIITNSFLTNEFELLLREIAVTYGATQLYQVTVPVIHFYDFFVFNQTEFPTSYPTSQPTSISAAPTSSPSQAPTLKLASGYLRFGVIFDISNISAPIISTDGEKTLLETITDVTDVPVEQLQYNGVIGGDGRRKLEAISWEMLLKVTLTIPLEEFPQFHRNPELLFEYLKSLFLSSVNEKVIIENLQNISLFTDHLHKNSMIWGNEFLWANVLSVEFSDWAVLDNTDVPTEMPTLMPTTANTYEGSLVFDAYWGLNETNCVTLSSEAQSALISTMSDIMDISNDNIEFIQVVDTNRRMLLASNTGMIVQTRVTVPLSDFAEFQGNKTRLYNYLVELLVQSMDPQDETFEKLFRNAAVQNGVTELSNVNVFELSFELIQFDHTPSAAPSFAPTNNNNNNGNVDEPTFKPTQAPTLANTQAPTTVGTKQTTPIMQYTAYIWIRNLTSSNSFSSDAQLALRNSIHDLLNMNLNDIQFIGITESLAAENGLVVSVKLTFNLIDYPSYTNATLLFLDTSKQLAAAAANGQFTSIFQTKAHEDNAADAKNGQIYQVTVQDFSVSNPSSISTSSSQQSLPSSTLAIIITCSIIGTALLVFFAYMIIFYYREEKSKKGSVAGSDNFSFASGLSGEDRVDFGSVYDGSSGWQEDDLIMITINDDAPTIPNRPVSFNVLNMNAFDIGRQMTVRENTYESRI